MKRLVLSLGALLVATSMAHGQAGPLPDYAYRAAGEAGIALGISPFCRGIRGNESGVQASMEAMYARLARDGYHPKRVQAHFDSAQGRAGVEAWISNWQKRHGARDSSMRDQCNAIRAEAQTNESLARQVRIRN